MQSKDHWEQVYSTKATSGVSWFQEHAQQPVQLVRQTGLARNAGIIDVGGGASTLVDDLLNEGYTNVTVLDLSEAALTASKSRLDQRADGASWLVGDITRVELHVMPMTSGMTEQFFISSLRQQNGRPMFRLSCAQLSLVGMSSWQHSQRTVLTSAVAYRSCGTAQMDCMQSSVSHSRFCSRSARNTTLRLARFRSSSTACAARSPTDFCLPAWPS